MITAYLRRERFYGSGDGYFVRIKDEATDDDGLQVSMGEVIGAWWEVPLPPCPDCGGEIVWYEAGYVPGTRKCTGCGSMFSVQTRKEPRKVEQAAVKSRFECDNGHVWHATKTDDESAGHKCPECGEYWQ